MPVIQTIVVDMSTRGLNPVAYSHQNDDFRTFHFEMKNNGEAVDLTGWSCKIGAILPGNDGGYRVIAGEEMADASIDGNIVSATLGSPYTDKAGNGVLTLIFTTPLDYTIRPINVDFRIQESADGEDVIAGASDFVPVLEQYMSDNMAEYIDAWLDDHPEATTTVADNSLTTAKYQDGSVTFNKLNAAMLGDPLTTAHMNASGNGLFWGLDYVTPEMFGAVGDGTNDDTAAFQSALVVGGLVICKPGAEYKITDVLQLYEKTTLDLNNSTIAPTFKHLFYNFSEDDIITGYEGAGNITIKNGTIDGGSMSLIHAENVLIENVKWKNCLNDHFLEICACNNYTVRGCSFVGMVSSSGTLEYINIDPCTSQSFPHLNNPSVFDGTPNKNIIIEKCYFSTGTGDYAYGSDAIGVHAGSDTLENHSNIMILDNTIKGFSEFAIRINQMDNVVVSGNQIETPANYCVEVGRFKTGKNVTITNNVMVKTGTNRTYYILFRPYGVNGLTVINNTYSSENSTDGGPSFHNYLHDNTTVFCLKQSEKFYLDGRSSVGAITSPFPLTSFNRLEIQTGGVGAGTLMIQTISSYYSRCFLVGETFPLLYDNSGTPAFATATITDAYTLTVTGTAPRTVYGYMENNITNLS